MQCENVVFALMKVWWMTRIFGELLTLSRSSPLSAASFLSNFWRRTLQKFNHQICRSPLSVSFTVNKTLSEWWEDGTGPITFHAHFNGQWDFFQSKNDLCSYFTIFASFCLSGNLFLSSLKQTTFTENDRLWCFLLAINIIFMHPSSLIIDSPSSSPFTTSVGINDQWCWLADRCSLVAPFCTNFAVSAAEGAKKYINQR